MTTIRQPFNLNLASGGLVAISNDGEVLPCRYVFSDAEYHTFAHEDMQFWVNIKTLESHPERTKVLGMATKDECELYGFEYQPDLNLEIKRLKTKLESRWIPIDVHLPKDVFVFVTTINGATCEAMYSVTRGEWIDRASNEIDEPVGYQFLPEPMIINPKPTESLLDDFFEINLANYTDDDVRRMNDWAINAYTAMKGGE